MAVVDKYVNEKIQKDKLAESVEIAGNKVFKMIQRFDVKASDGDSVGSVYRLFKVGANVIPVSLKFVCTAVTGLSGKLGIYEEGGKAYDDDALASNVSLASEAGLSSPVEGLSALNVNTYGKKVYELAGHTVSDKDAGYDIALTLAGAPSADGTVVVIGEFIQG